MKKYLYISIFLFLVFCNTLIIDAQSEFHDSIKKNSVFLELGGNGLLYSINYDRIFKISKKINVATRIGLHFSDNFNSNDIRAIGFPFEISGLYSILRDKHFVELGPGLTLFNEKDHSRNHTETLCILALRAGYRFQKPNGGLFIKVGFTPLYDLYLFNPSENIKYHEWFIFGGLGIGYTF